MDIGVKDFRVKQRKGAAAHAAGSNEAVTKPKVQTKTSVAPTPNGGKRLLGRALHTVASKEVEAAVTIQRHVKGRNIRKKYTEMKKKEQNLMSEEGKKKKPHLVTDKIGEEPARKEEVKASEVAEQAETVDIKAELEKELAQFVGLASLKEQLRTWAHSRLNQLVRERKGIEMEKNAAMPHMMFLGNPGTGKTSVSRTMARLLHMLGLLPSDKLVEVQRSDLVAEFIGQTRPKTRRKLDEAGGGVLFVDEAYQLFPPGAESGKDFGRESVEEIMMGMDQAADLKLVVIFAGYESEMHRVLEANAGLGRRLQHRFQFPDYTCAEIAAVMTWQMQHGNGKGFRLGEGVTEAWLTQLIESRSTPEHRSKRNAAIARDLIYKARESLDNRIADPTIAPTGFLMTITREDFEKASDKTFPGT